LFHLLKHSLLSTLQLYFFLSLHKWKVLKSKIETTFVRGWIGKSVKNIYWFIIAQFGSWIVAFISKLQIFIMKTHGWAFEGLALCKLYWKKVQQNGRQLWRWRQKVRFLLWKFGLISIQFTSLDCKPGAFMSFLCKFFFNTFISYSDGPCEDLIRKLQLHCNLQFFVRREQGTF
jgi:hypothetical protein